LSGINGVETWLCSWPSGMWPWPCGCDLVKITADGILELNYNLIAFQSKALTTTNLRPTTRECVHFVTHFVTSGHVTKMAVPPLDSPYPKTPCYAQTSRLYEFWNWSYCRSMSFPLRY